MTRPYSAPVIMLRYQYSKEGCRTVNIFSAEVEQIVKAAKKDNGTEDNDALDLAIERLWDLAVKDAMGHLLIDLRDAKESSPPGGRSRTTSMGREAS
jgi:hypothetical protein